jgi:hypothetical protein
MSYAVPCRHVSSNAPGVPCCEVGMGYRTWDMFSEWIPPSQAGRTEKDLHTLFPGTGYTLPILFVQYSGFAMRSNDKDSLRRASQARVRCSMS